MEVATGSQPPVHGNHEVYLPQSEFKNYCDVQAKAIQYEFEGTHDNMNFSFAQLDHWIDCLADDTATGVDSLVTFQNSKISRLHQRIQAVQIFDPSPGLNSSVTLKAPKGFPMKVDTFLNTIDSSKQLQYSKVCPPSGRSHEALKPYPLLYYLFN